MAAIEVPSLNMDNKAPDFAQHLTQDVNDALSRMANSVAPIDSPAFTGDPTAPTPSPGDSDTSIATTAFVSDAVTTAVTAIGIAAVNAAITAFKNVVSATYATRAALSASIPVDDTIPQSSEGTQILSVTITPTSSTSKIRLRGHGWGYVDINSNEVYAVFSSQSANAIQSGIWFASALTGQFAGFAFNVVHSPATTSAVTYSVRVGPESGSGATLYLNGDNTSRYLGGSSAAYLIAEELPV